MRDGAKLAFLEASNSGNLLDGETLTILEADSTCVDSAAATAAAEQLVADGVAAATPSATSCSAAAVAAAESTQVESASRIVKVSPSSRFPEFEASRNANFAPSLIAGVRD